MTGREGPRAPDPDDWWSSSSASAPRSAARSSRRPASDTSVTQPSGRVEPEDWLDEGGAESAGRFGMPADPRQRAAIVVVAALLLVVGLIASGVFAGGKRPTATTSTGPTTSASTTPSTPAAAVPPPPTATLVPGASGSEVKVLQRALAALGFSVGAVDGSYGPATERALKRFQRTHGLGADGVLGAKTLAALTLALRP